MDKRQYKEKKFWERFANNYDKFIKRTLSNTYKVIIDNLNSELNANQNVLEIGTGTGIIPFSVCSKVSSIIATDISPEMIRVASQKQKDSGITNIDFQVQDSYNLPFPDKSFDVVIATNLLHLLFDPEKPLSEVKRVMKDNGIFIAPTFCVGEDFKSKVLTSIAGFVSGFKIVNKWSVKDYNSMLVNNGFTIIKTIRVDGRFKLAYTTMKK